MSLSNKPSLKLESKNLITITCCVLIFSFFIRWFNFMGFTVSGYDIVFSGLWDIQPEQGFWSRNSSSNTNYVPLFRYLLLVAPLISSYILYSLYLSQTKTYNFILNRVPFFALLILIFFIFAQDSRHNDKKEFFKLFFETVSIGFWLNIIGIFVLLFINENYDSQTIENTSPASTTDTTPPPVPQEQEIFNTVKEENRPVINIPKFTIPAIDFRAIAGSVSDFVKENRKIILISSIVVISFIIGYYLFLKNYPDKDAQKASEMFCNCDEARINDIIKINESFINNFAAYAFKSKQGARNKVLELQKTANDRFIECNNKFQNAYADLRKKYHSSQEELGKFDFTFNAGKESCITANVQKLSLQNTEVEKKISTINDPIPDIEKIKSDLLGKQVAGWKFDFLNEFKEAKIMKSLMTNGRIEFQTKFTLQGATDMEPHDCELLAVYLQNDYGWYMNDFKLLSITYTNIAPVDRWEAVYGLENCKIQIEDNKEKYWIQSIHYGGRYQGGGDDGEKFELIGKDFSISSRETHPVKVIFKYTPIN